MLKSTGIVRKIDELGRIVIPKELRSMLGIANGDELEIFIENELIVLKKYSQLLNNKDKTNNLVSKITNLVDGILLIADKEVILTSGKFENKKIPNTIKNIILSRQNYCLNDKEVYLFDELEISGYFYFSPIIQDSNANGVIILVKNNRINKEDVVFVSVLKNIIEKS
ncbi:MAG: AbrB/MazE/SpoVT family DNA-binding domain-containing protein [Bacilli bacterium]|nr:AbrB/MazE/SpoVT family DNA-binding domain-containing protein [Bacilli bacterium]